jgi:hypothetical protein
MWNARIAMKAYLTVCFALGWLVLSSQAQESTPTPDGESPKIATASADEETYVALMKSQVELSTQFKLLVSLASEHRKRADEAAAASQGPKAVWETEIAKELHDKSDVLLKQLSEATKQRQAFEQAHKNVAVSLGNLNAAAADARVSPQEVEFIKKIDERMDRLSQDLLAARQSSATYAMQMQTNKMPYDYQQAAEVFQQNARKIRQLEQEQSDVELRKLEFQALRRP